MAPLLKMCWAETNNSVVATNLRPLTHEALHMLGSQCFGAQTRISSFNDAIGKKTYHLLSYHRHERTLQYLLLLTLSLRYTPKPAGPIAVMESHADPIIISQPGAPEDAIVVPVVALAKDAPEPDLAIEIPIPVVETSRDSLAETPSAASVPDPASPTASSDAPTELSSSDTETPVPVLVPEIQVFLLDDPALSTRPGTPASFVSTAPTTVSQLSDDHLDDGTRSPKPILSTPLVLGPEVDDSEITALSLSPPVFPPKTSQRGRSASQGATVRSLPGSPIVKALSPPIQRPSRSCPTSPELQPTTVPPGPKPTLPKNPFNQAPSRAAQLWDERKKRGETSKILDELMLYQGLEEVKRQFLDIKSKVDICEKQGRDLKQERFNVVFQGNPGTGQIYSSVC